MRTISDTIYDRVRALRQTKANNCNPRLEAIITRHVVPLVDYAMWQKVIIPAVAPTRTSIAARRPDKKAGPDYLYVGEVEDGAAVIYGAAFSGTVPPAAFTVVESIADAVDIALAFEGEYTRYRDKVEFVTTGAPWVFWIDAAGDVYGRRVGDASGTLLASSAVAVSAVMGVASILGAISEGLVLAYATSAGAVYTRQYLDGEWETAGIVSGAPANVVDLALSRTWDYRVCMQLEVSGGAVYLMLGKSMIMGNANNEQIEVTGVELAADVYATIPRDAHENERIEVAGAELSTDIYSAIAPTIVSVANINDGTGNYGLILRVTFSGPVYDITGQAGAFVLGGSFTGEAIAYDPADPDLQTLLLSMADFNNAASPSDLVYTPGTLASGPSVTLVEAQTVSVTLTDLVPSSPPVPVSIEAVDNVTIDITFDMLLSSADIGANSAAFAVSGYEPAYSPGGSLVPTNYVVSGVAFGATNDVVRITLTEAGRLKYPQGNVTVAYTASAGNLKNASGTLSVATFNQAFDPEEAILDLVFNPMAVEYIQVAAIDMTIDVNAVTFENGYLDEHIEIENLDLTVAVYDTAENPV